MKSDLASNKQLAELEKSKAVPDIIRVEVSRELGIEGNNMSIAFLRVVDRGLSVIPSSIGLGMDAEVAIDVELEPRGSGASVSE